MDPMTRLTFILWFLLIAASCTELCRADESPIRAAAISAGYAHDIDPDLVLAVIEVESQFRVDAVGVSHGEIGLMQLNPRWFPNASFDIEANVNAGVAYLAKLRSYCKVDCDGYGWVALYNTGPRQVERKRQLPYFKKVMRAYVNRKGARYAVLLD